MSNKLTQIAREILAIEADLPFRLKYDAKERATVDDFEMYTFEQVWGSTALGFGGVGGQTMTSARTYVFIPVQVDQKCFVYFAGRFAYAADYSKEFMQDVFSGNMPSVALSGKYRKHSSSNDA